VVVGKDTHNRYVGVYAHLRGSRARPQDRAAGGGAAGRLDVARRARTARSRGLWGRRSADNRKRPRGRPHQTEAPTMVSGVAPRPRTGRTLMPESYPRRTLERVRAFLLRQLRDLVLWRLARIQGDRARRRLLRTLEGAVRISVLRHQGCSLGFATSLWLWHLERTLRLSVRKRRSLHAKAEALGALRTEEPWRSRR